MKAALLSLSLLNAGLAIGQILILHQPDTAILFMLIAIYLVLLSREWPCK